MRDGFLEKGSVVGERPRSVNMLLDIRPIYITNYTILGERRWGTFEPTGEGFMMVATISLMRVGFLVISWEGVRGVAGGHYFPEYRGLFPGAVWGAQTVPQTGFEKNRSLSTVRMIFGLLSRIWHMSLFPRGETDSWIF